MNPELKAYLKSCDELEKNYMLLACDQRREEFVGEFAQMSVNEFRNDFESAAAHAGCMMESGSRLQRMVGELAMVGLLHVIESLHEAAEEGGGECG